MRTVWLFLRWIFSNSGVVQGSVGKTQMAPKVMLIYMMSKHPLVMEKCPCCKTVYWAFTKGNKYCGQFSCFRRIHASK